jgi:hypothetical protein
MESQIRIRLSSDDKKALLELSRLRGVTISAMIRSFIDSQLKAA